MSTPVCKDCKRPVMLRLGKKNQYYCSHPESEVGGHEMICEIDGQSDIITIDGAPDWCPLRDK